MHRQVSTLCSFVVLSLYGRWHLATDDIFHWVQSIEDSRKFDHICQFLRVLKGQTGHSTVQDGHSPAVNFDNLSFEKKTIGYWQRVGMLYFAEITRYVLLLG